MPPLIGSPSSATRALITVAFRAARFAFAAWCVVVLRTRVISAADSTMTPVQMPTGRTGAAASRRRKSSSARTFRTPDPSSRL